MSKENLEQFMNKVDDTEELQAKIGGEIDAEALIALGAECGCEFTFDDLFGSLSFFFIGAEYDPWYVNLKYHSPLGLGKDLIFMVKCNMTNKLILKSFLSS